MNIFILFYFIGLFTQNSVSAEDDEYDGIFDEFMNPGTLENTSIKFENPTSESDSLARIFTENETQVVSTTSTEMNPSLNLSTSSTEEESQSLSNEKNSPTTVNLTSESALSSNITSYSTFMSNTTTVSSITTPSEKEEVVLGDPTLSSTISITKTFLQKSIELMSNTYTLSILLPIAAGVAFALSIIVTFAICNCIRRRCRRKRFRNKMLPNSVKELRPSDRTRLLAESSDEEF